MSGPLATRRALPLVAAALAASLAAFLTACQTTTTVNGVPVATRPADEQPTSPDEMRRRAEVRLQLAGSYYVQGQLQTAIDEAHHALQLNPNLAGAYALLGIIYMNLADRRESEANFSRALALDPDGGEVNNNYGWYLCHTQRERESIRYFDRAAANRLYATPAMAMQNAGVCLFQVGDYNGAERYLKRAFEADASSPVAKFQLARLYLIRGELERANFYYDLLQKTVDPRADSLWLGVRIAHAASDTKTEQKRAEELRRRFPDSRETAALDRGAFDE
jgi:type IV pilus assembly protein PilF